MEKSIIRPVLVLLVIVFTVVIMLGMLLYAKVYGQEIDTYSDLTAEERELALDLERKYVTSRHGKILRFKGDAEIAEDEAIRGDVVVLKGNLRISGEVGGNVLVLFGDVEVDSTALVDGDVVSAGGKIWRERGADILGDVIETDHLFDRDRHRSTGYRNARDSYEREKRTYTRRRKWKNERTTCINLGQLEEDDLGSAWLDYNRVDGLTLGLRLPSQCWWDERRHNFAILGKGGYSFASKQLQYQLGLERWMLDTFRFSLGGEIHDLTDSQDNWIISSMENSLAAFLIKEDFRDYYRREGFSAYIRQNFGSCLSVKADYRSDRFWNLEQETKWSLFGSHKRFRPNPSALPMNFVDTNGISKTDMENLELQSFAATVTLDTRNSNKNPDRGWLLQAFGERSGHELESDMEFERFIVDLRRYQPLGWDENLDIRLRAGSATGVLPPMYWFDLGGISTLRGYDFKEFTGDRMVLGNLEYRLRPGRSDWFILDGFDLVLFVDSGLAWFANSGGSDSLKTYPIWFLPPHGVELEWNTNRKTEPSSVEDSFDDLTWSKLKTNVGIALASHDDDFRINFAKRTDRSGRDIVITVRFSREF